MFLQPNESWLLRVKSWRRLDNHFSLLLSIVRGAKMRLRTTLSVQWVYSISWELDCNIELQLLHGVPIILRIVSVQGESLCIVLSCSYNMVNLSRWRWCMTQHSHSRVNKAPLEVSISVSVWVIPSVVTSIAVVWISISIIREAVIT